jgi:hypothetical protein
MKQQGAPMAGHGFDAKRKQLFEHEDADPVHRSWEFRGVSETERMPDMTSAMMFNWNHPCPSRADALVISLRLKREFGGEEIVNEIVWI